MRSKILLSIAIVLTLLVASVWAADVAGKWTSERQGRDGQPSITTYDFKVAGAALTGTVTSPGFGGGEPTATAITEGKIDGDSITFVVVRKFNEMEMKSTYKGKVSGDEIKFTIERPAMGGMGGPGGGGPGGGMGAPGGGAPGGGGPGGGMGAGRGGPQEIIAKRVK
jgi:hypothetical protein